MTIVYSLVSRQKTVLAEYTATSGKTRRVKEKHDRGLASSTMATSGLQERSSLLRAGSRV